LIVGLLAVLWTAAAPAGEIKTHYWPSAPIPLEIASIPVVMDVGYWIKIVNQNAFIKLKQKSINTYEGCTDLQIRCNVDLAMSCSISPTGTVKGTYSCSIVGPNINVPGGTMAVCAMLKNPDLVSHPGGTTNLQVATVTIRVVPRSL